MIGVPVISIRSRASASFWALVPGRTATVANVETVGATDRVGVGPADAGYWSQANAEAGDVLGIDVLIATTKSHRVGASAGDEADETSVRDHQRLRVVTRIDDGEITIAEAARQFGLSHSWLSTLLTRYRRHGSLVSEAMLARLEMERRLAQPASRDRYRQR